LLKALGFRQRQLSIAVAWQASVTALIGVLVGVPSGILIGRWFWTFFARRIYAVPDSTVPVLQVLFIALGAIVLANLVAVVLARSAARTPTALILRAE
jgi:ABC-type lipoprotein release transport system permease subunit